MRKALGIDLAPLLDDPLPPRGFEPWEPWPRWSPNGCSRPGSGRSPSPMTMTFAPSVISKEGSPMPQTPEASGRVTYACAQHVETMKGPEIHENRA